MWTCRDNTAYKQIHGRCVIFDILENCVSLLTLQREDWQHVTVVSVMVGLYVLYLGWHMIRSSQGTDTRALQVPTGKTEWILFHWHCCLKNKQKQTNSCVSDVECLGFCPLLPISSLHAELTYKQSGFNSPSGPRVIWINVIFTHISFSSVESL